MSQKSNTRGYGFSVIRMVRFFLNFGELGGLYNVPGPGVVPDAVTPTASGISVPFRRRDTLSFMGEWCTIWGVPTPKAEKGVPRDEWAIANVRHTTTGVHTVVMERDITVDSKGAAPVSG